VTSLSVVIFQHLVVLYLGSASDRDFSHPERFYKSRRTGVRGDYALIAAICGLVPMMFMTRVRL
jgi:hypothetical protein